jgi:hypothetical protein
MTSAIRPTPLFRAIDDNVRRGTAAFTHTLRAAKRQVAEGRTAEVAITERLAALLLAAQYECRLHWLLNHPESRLDSGEIDYIRNSGGVAKKWNALLRAALAMRKGERVGATYLPDSIPAILDRDERRRYRGITRVTDEYLNVLIDLRNSLAHGEWETALTQRADAINHARTTKIRSLTLYRVVVLANILDHLWRMHFDAQVTYFAFERDFDRHYRAIRFGAERMERGDEARWLDAIRRRYKGGRLGREALGMPPEIGRYVLRLPRTSKPQAAPESP